MRIIDVPQTSPEWFAARLGVPSASNFDMIVTTKGERSKQRDKYLYRLAGETVAGKSEETYQNAAMQRGIELEAEARQLYELITGNTTTQVGFCIHDEGYGASPDSLVGDDTTIEIKCPTMAVHVGYLLENRLPVEYIQQVQGQLLVTDRKYADFTSYYPGIRPLIVRVERDEKFIQLLRTELLLFVNDLKEVVAKIK